MKLKLVFWGIGTCFLGLTLWTGIEGSKPAKNAWLLYAGSLSSAIVAGSCFIAPTILETPIEDEDKLEPITSEDVIASWQYSDRLFLREAAAELGMNRVETDYLLEQN